MLPRLPLLALLTVLGGCVGPDSCPAPPQPAWLDFGTHTELGCRRALEKALECERSRDVLALSGGGQNGAFGAGVLDGWRDQDGSPRKFAIVTGVSAGALLATSAFLATEDAYADMVAAFTTIDQDDILSFRSLPSIPVSPSIAKPNGLRKLIDHYISDERIDEVARESAGGRVLLVGTVNLVTGTFQPWNLSYIASRKQYDKYRKIVLASASVPILFPPVEIDGVPHVDGGAREQVFVRLICDLSRSSKVFPPPPAPTVHVIVNGALGIEPECVEESLLGVGLRSLDTLMNEALIGNLWRVYGTAQEGGLGFRYIQIPESAARRLSGSMAFEPEEMTYLYRIGRALGRRPDSWMDRPRSN